MNMVRIGQIDSNEIVNVRWKALKAGFVAHESMYVYQKQGSFVIDGVLVWY